MRGERGPQPGACSRKQPAINGHAVCTASFPDAATKTPANPCLHPPPLCRLIGQAAHALQEYGQAELAYRRALDVRADCLPAWVGLARLFAATGNTAGAVEANERAVGAAPLQHSLLLLLLLHCSCTAAWLER